jgi:hypothetical protein
MTSQHDAALATRLAPAESGQLIGSVIGVLVLQALAPTRVQRACPRHEAKGGK